MITTLSGLHDIIMTRYYKFLIVNVLVFFCVGTAALQSVLISIGASSASERHREDTARMGSNSTKDQFQNTRWRTSDGSACVKSRPAMSKRLRRRKNGMGAYQYCLLLFRSDLLFLSPCDYK